MALVSNLSVHFVTSIEVREPESYLTPGLLGSFQRVALRAADGNVIEISIHLEPGCEPLPVRLPKESVK